MTSAVTPWCCPTKASPGLELLLGLSHRDYGGSVAVSAQKGNTVFDWHLLRVVSRFLDHKQRRAGRGLQNSGIFLLGGHRPDDLLRPMQFTFVDVLDDVIERLLLQILLVYAGKQASGQVTGDNGHRLGIDEAEPSNAINAFPGAELQRLCDFHFGFQQIGSKQSGGWRQSAAPHFLAESAKLLEIPGNPARADDGTLAPGYNQQSFRTQFLEGLAHGHLADTKQACDFAFGAESLAFLEYAVLYEGAHLVNDLFIERDKAAAIQGEMQLLRHDLLECRRECHRIFLYATSYHHCIQCSYPR